MMFNGRERLLAFSVCILLLVTPHVLVQTAAAQQTNHGQESQSAPQTTNPFESVPQGAEATAPETEPQAQPSPFEAPPTAEEPKPGEVQDIIEAIEFRGSRRVPQDTLRAMIFTKKGDRYDPDTLHRDFIALWNTGRFDDITLERERGEFGWVIRFRVVERRVVRSIKYEGIKSVTVSDILDRFKERRVGLTVESQYEPSKVQYAVVVLKEFLAERGRQYATVEPELRQIPPTSLEVVFRVNEGPKVKVGNIKIEGNEVFSDRQIRRSMRMLKPIGIPHSILFENLFAKAFDSVKLEIDKEMIRDFYQQRGYFTAQALEHEVTMRDVGGGKFRIPLIRPNKPGKRADIKINVEEGRQYRLNKIIFEGVELFRTPEILMEPLFEMAEGDIFSTEKLRKGIENMQKLYGEFGYIDFVPEPDFYPIPNTDRIDLTLSVDEGDQFFVRRIDFSGNTTTRDKVIRRELLLDEGNVFDTRRWEVSLLRLNQLGYFETLKEEESADIRRDTKSKTVDITLNVKERGKNSVQMTGGVSGIAGTFLGFGYATNNFLGLGETLSIDAQLGDRMQNVTFGYTEPYLFDRPIQGGFTIYKSRFNFDQGREISLTTGRNFIPLYESLGAENLLNYVSQGYGFTSFVSYPLKRSFARVSMTYGYSNQDIEPLTDSAETYFEYSNFLGLSGPNSLNGIRTSRVVPAYTYNTVDHPITPSRGKSLFISASIAGLGGNVKMITPTVDFKIFRSGLKPGHVIGFHALGRIVTGYGGITPPPFNRFYMGGENDIRGFQIYGISPVAWVASSATVPVLNSDGSQRTQKIIVDGELSTVTMSQNIPRYQIVFPGGDTQIVGNFEYRIPIAGPVTLALFTDAGLNKITFPGQIRLNEGRVASLNGLFPQAGFDTRAVIHSKSQMIRTSVGAELQIMMPVMNAPFRLYWAYNPTILRTYLQAPIVANRSYFPNRATFVNSILETGTASPLYEDRTTFRFTISRTF